MVTKVFESEDTGTSMRTYMNFRGKLFIGIYADGFDNVEESQIITLDKDDVVELISELKKILKEMP